MSKKQKRRRLKSSTPARASVEKPAELSPNPNQSSRAKFSLPFKLTWKFVSAASVVIGFLSVVFLLPRVSVEPGATLDSTRPFETRFVLENQGVTPIQEVSFVAMWTPLDGGRVAPGIDAAGASGWTPIPRMSAFEKQTFGLNFGPYTNVGPSALVEIAVMYRPAFWFRATTKRFNFVTERDKAGQYQWSPVRGNPKHLHIKGDDR